LAKTWPGLGGSPPTELVALEAVIVKGAVILALIWIGLLAIAGGTLAVVVLHERSRRR